MAGNKNQSKITTAIYIIAVILFLVALVGIIVAFTRSDKPPAEDGTLLVNIDGQTVENGSSVGVLANGAYITVEGVSEFDVAVYVYGTAENDFTFTVDGEEYSWSGINNRNMTKGFTFEQTENSFTILYESISRIISATQNGAEVSVGTLPLVYIFFLSFKTENDHADIYFCLEYILELDKAQIVF